MPCDLSDVTRALEKRSYDNSIFQTTLNKLLKGTRSENSSVRQSVLSKVVRLGEKCAEKPATILKKQEQLQRTLSSVEADIRNPPRSRTFQCRHCGGERYGAW